MTTEQRGTLGSECNDGLSAPTDEDLAELLAFVRGEGRWAWLGQGLTSHPQSTGDANQQRIHAAMMLLEARGDVRRHYVSEGGSVTWAPNVANNRPANGRSG